MDEYKLLAMFATANTSFMSVSEALPFGLNTDGAKSRNVDIKVPRSARAICYTITMYQIRLS